ncbi:cytidylyltransferase domain-containing protein [Methanobacterium sp. 42_16]|uniref:acylneuraminate cytidylyltransferase family protein n=1 Tax=Methanobacterium sp. 42_16 TaxID=1641383 RepID=UPI000749E5B1|nr:acylneuraminate cytidylyltransferase family protein [Methanobacterium sp. 42_16]KUK75386.1 MAG: CMP-N-acetylneuraminic acid synthetase [Methanobacterium sp. 42_16]
MKILVTICARQGSKRVKNKNIREIAGKPLIAHTIETAKEWGKADKIIVSTDSEEIAEISRTYGAEVPFLRPENLSNDTAPKLPVIQHAVKYLKDIQGEEFDLIVDLDPTSPLRTVKDIEKAYNIMVNEKPLNLFSVCPARKNPYFNMVELDSSGYAKLCKMTENRKIFRMQDTPTVYEMNAAIYMYWAKKLFTMDTVITDASLIYEMPPERSIDIDSETDFKLVEFLLGHKTNRFP